MDLGGESCPTFSSDKQPSRKNKLFGKQPESVLQFIKSPYQSNCCIDNGIVKDRGHKFPILISRWEDSI